MTLLVLFAITHVNPLQLVGAQHNALVVVVVVEKSSVDKLNQKPTYKHLEEISGNATVIDDKEVEPKESINCRFCH